MKIKFTDTGLTSDQLTNIISLASHRMPSDSVEALYGSKWIISGIQVNTDELTSDQRSDVIEKILDFIGCPESIPSAVEDTIPE